MADDGAGDERLRVLQLLEEGKISAAEAADLLTALRQPPPPAGRARWFRVRVTDQRSGRTRTNVSVPIGMLGFGLGFARRLQSARHRAGRRPVRGGAQRPARGDL